MSLLSGFEHIVRENEPLSPYTRLKIGGAAEYFAEPTSREELIGLISRFATEDRQIRLLGSGTNLLVSDEGVSGLVIHLSAPAFGEIEVKENRLIAGGGAKLSHFVSTAVREGFSGPEQLVGLPGTIGGALHNNTGAHGVDIGTWVTSAEVLTRAGELATRDKESMSFSYRRSSLSELVILKAEFEFEQEPSEALTKEMQKLWIFRRASQPAVDQNAAYMFEDVGGDSAGKLIEQAGLKGQRVGNVELLDVDPNFLVTEPACTSKDVLAMIELVKTQVRERLEIELETAIQIW